MISLATAFLGDHRYRPFLHILASRAPDNMLHLQPRLPRCELDPCQIGSDFKHDNTKSDYDAKYTHVSSLAVSSIPNAQNKNPPLCELSMNNYILSKSDWGRLSSVVITHPTLVGETITAQKVSIIGKEIRDCTIIAPVVNIDCFKLVDTEMPECQKLLVKTNFIDGALPKFITHLDLELRSWDSLHEDMFSHLVNAKQLVLTYEWEMTCSLFLPPLVESIELVDMEIIESQSPIFIRVPLLRLVIFRNCSFEDLSYYQLGCPPRLQAIDFVSCRSYFTSFESFRQNYCSLKVNGEDITSGGESTDNDALICS